jgi:hypothetical protein
MGFSPKMKTAGGGGARPVADAFNQYLLSQLNQAGGSGFQGMMSGQNNPSPLSFNTQVDMNDPQFAAMNQMLMQQQQQGLAGLNERFTGPNSRGTPGAFANASFLAQSGPQNILAMGNLADQIRNQNRADLGMQWQDQIARMQMDQNRMNMMMNAFQQSNTLGTPQAQTYMQPGGGSQILQGLAGIAPFALAPFTGGASLGLGMFGGGGRGGNVIGLDPISKLGFGGK